MHFPHDGGGRMVGITQLFLDPPSKNAAPSFPPRAPARPCLTYSTMLCLWRRIRSPFVLPIGLHSCQSGDWELFECNEAGCRVCGEVHRCDSQTCTLVPSNGYQVCEITGFCIKGNVFAEDEFLARSLADHGCKHGLASSRPRVVGDGDQIHAWVQEMLCSSKTRAALVSENEKRTHRLQNGFIRTVKLTRARAQPLNLVNVCAAMAASVLHCRTPLLLPTDALDELARRCTTLVECFLHRFLEMERRVAIPGIKMRGFVIGVLYLMRSGVCLCDSVDILPRVPALVHCLPLENQLQGRFHLSTKIITEAENCIKRTLRGVSRQELEAQGFAAY